VLKRLENKSKMIPFIVEVWANLKKNEKTTRPSSQPHPNPSLMLTTCQPPPPPTP